MIDHRIRLIRLLLATLAASVLAGCGCWWFWLPVALFMPAFAAAGTCATGCSDTGETMTITTTGIVNNNCLNCNDYNTAWVVPNLTDFGFPCHWAATLDTPTSCGGGGSPAATTVEVIEATHGNFKVRVDVHAATSGLNAINIAWENTAVAGPRTCLGVIPFLSNVDGGCNGSGSTLTLS